jgi:thiamine kinase-like enzyme
MSKQIEIPFTSGESADVVVRVENTVRRSLGENSERVHQIYKELEKSDFKLAPRLLGIDEKGREIITYIDGKNITDEVLTIDLAIEAVKALKKFHDILAKSDITENQETVCHRDFAPWNVLQANNHVVGIIDFDDAYPGARITDLAYACWTFLNLGDSSSKKGDQEQVNEIKRLVDAYGSIDTSNFIEELLNEQNRILEYRKERINQAENEEEKEARKKIYDEIANQIDWVQRNSDLINEALIN